MEINSTQKILALARFKLPPVEAKFYEGHALPSELAGPSCSGELFDWKKNYLKKFDNRFGIQYMNQKKLDWLPCKPRKLGLMNQTGPSNSKSDDKIEQQNPFDSISKVKIQFRLKDDVKIRFNSSNFE